MDILKRSVQSVQMDSDGIIRNLTRITADVLKDTRDTVLLQTTIADIVNGKTATDDFYGHLLQCLTISRSGRVEVTLQSLPVRWIYSI